VRADFRGFAEILCLAALVAGVMWYAPASESGAERLAIAATAGLVILAALQSSPAWFRGAGWYVLFIAAVTTGVLANPSASSLLLYWHVLLFGSLAFVVTCARHPRRAALTAVALFVALAGLVLVDALHYDVQGLTSRGATLLIVSQWGGYPELGLLASLGAAAAIAVVSAPGRWPTKTLAGLAFAGFVLAALAVLSRGAWVTIALVTAWAILRTRRFGHYRLLTASVLLLAVLATVFTLYTSRAIQEYMSSFASPTDGLFVAFRLAQWRLAVGLIAEHPIVGVGLGGYAEASAAVDQSLGSLHAHNTFLNMAAEAGLPAAVLWVGLWIRILWKSLSAAGAGSLAAWTLHCMLAAFFIRSQIDAFVMLRPRLLILLGIFFGLSEALYATTAARGTAAGLPVRRVPAASTVDSGVVRAPAARAEDSPGSA